MKKACIIAFFFLSLQSCGTFQLSTVGHQPQKQVRVIVEHDYHSHWYFGLTDPYWRYRLYTRQHYPRRVIVRPATPKIRVKGTRSRSKTKGRR